MALRGVGIKFYFICLPFESNQLAVQRNARCCAEKSHAEWLANIHKKQASCSKYIKTVNHLYQHVWHRLSQLALRCIIYALCGSKKISICTPSGVSRNSKGEGRARLSITSGTHQSSSRYSVIITPYFALIIHDLL